MRRTPGAVLLLLTIAGCRPAPGGFTLLFLGRFPAANVGELSWAPDPDRSRLVAFDPALAPVHTITSPDLAAPMAVAALGDQLLISENTGEGVVLDTSGHVVREWQSPFAAAVYVANSVSGTIVAARSPYRIPLARAEPDTAPLIAVLDTLGRPAAGLATIHVPATALLTAYPPRNPDGKHNSAQSVLVKPIGTQDLLRQIEALLVQHQDEKQSRARLAHFDTPSAQKEQKAG